MGVENISKSTIMDWTIRIVGLLMSIIIAVSCFFLKEAWYKISSIENEVHSLKLVDVEIRSNKFTSSDWVTAKSILDSERLSQDRRIMRVEEAIPSIKESLLEIKQTLKEDRR